MNEPTPIDIDLNALMQEQRRRWQQGTSILVEALLKEHAVFRDQKDALLDLINHEIILRTEFGAPAKREEYLQRFPDLKTDLLMLFEVHDALEGERDQAAPTIAGHEISSLPADDWPKLPNYEVIEVLGEGGMGIVYKALDRRLKRPVALKMIRNARAGAEERRRFQAEAEAVAKLDHPGIVHIYEVGEYERQPFVALEYLDGGTLAQHLNSVPQAPPAAALLIETLARSVHYAHGIGVIHRDLKPANILMQRIAESASGIGESTHWVREGVAYLLKIADFGLAKQVQSNSDATQTQAIVGTPSYMAPEQAGDFARRIGPAADVYSLGAILYELLTGRPPFRGATVLDTLDQVRTQDPIPPTRLQPKVPRDLETICLKCLRKDPAQRYGSAEGLADDLGRFLRHEPIRARPTSTLEHLSKWCRRRPAVATLFVMAFVIAFVGFPLVTYLWVQTLESNARLQGQLYDYKIRLADRYWRDNRIDHLQVALDSLRPKVGERDLRDFEWYYLEGLLHKDLMRVPANGCLAYSPDGLLLAAGAKHEIHLWKTADLEKPNPQPIARLPGHSADLVSLAFSPKGDRLLSAAKDREVRLWDVAGQKMIRRFPDHPADVTAVAFHPVDGSTATACKDGIIRLWEPDGAKRLDLDERAGAVNDIAFSANGKRLVSANADKSVIVWDVAVGDLLHKLEGHAAAVNCLAVHGQRIASAGFDPHIHIWDMDKGILIQAFPKMPQVVQRLAFNGDGKRLAAACRGQPIFLWNTDPARKAYPNEPTHLIRGNFGLVEGLAFSPRGDRLASVSQDGTLRLWNPHQAQDSIAYDLPTIGNRLALHPHRPLVAIAAMDKNVHLVNWQTGERKVLASHAGAVHAVAFASDGTLASAGEDGTIRVWDVSTEKMLREIPGNGKTIAMLDFHPGGHRLVSTGLDGEIQFWETASGRKLHPGPAHAKSVTDLAFSPDGRWLASAGADGVVIVCAAETGKEVRRFTDAGCTPASLAFSSDGQFLGAGDKQSTIRIWNLRTGTLTHRLEGHEGAIDAIAFSRRGTRLASAAGIGDATIKIWDLTTGLELLTLRGHGRDVSAVVFAPDDTALISLGRNAIRQDQLRIWDAAKR